MRRTITLILTLNTKMSSTCITGNTRTEKVFETYPNMNSKRNPSTMLHHTNISVVHLNTTTNAIIRTTILRKNKIRLAQPTHAPSSKLKPNTNTNHNRGRNISTTSQKRQNHTLIGAISPNVKFPNINTNKNLRNGRTKSSNDNFDIFNIPTALGICNNQLMNYQESKSIFI